MKYYTYFIDCISSVTFHCDYNELFKHFIYIIYTITTKILRRNVNSMLCCTLVMLLRLSANGFSKGTKVARSLEILIFIVSRKQVPLNVPIN